MGIFSKKKKEEIVAIFDVGSGSVGGSMVLTRFMNKPIVLASFRKSFPLRDSIDSNSLLKEMLVSLKEVSEEIQKQSKTVPAKVYIILSSPWVETSLKYIRRRRKEDFIFTQKQARELIEEESDSFVNHHESFNQIIDKKITNVLLNGYNVSNPHGKKTRELEIQLFLSVSSQELIDKMEDVVQKVFHKKVFFTSQMFSDAMVVRDIFDDLNSFILIDIDEETTEVSVMRNDLLVGTASFPYGKNTSIRTIAKSLGRNINDIQSFLSTHTENHLHEIHSEDLEAAIKIANKEWIFSLKKVFRVLFSELLIPHHIFLITDRKSEKWFKHLLNKNNFSEFTTTEESFSVIIGDTKLLHDFCDFPLGVLPDSSLTMQSIFINTINFK